MVHPIQSEEIEFLVFFVSFVHFSVQGISKINIPTRKVEVLKLVEVT